MVKKFKQKSNYNHVAATHKKIQRNGIWAKDIIIPQYLVGKSVLIDDDGTPKNCIITPDKVGFKFGDFTREKELYRNVDNRGKTNILSLIKNNKKN
jgi:ribosomal protein S19